MEDRQFAENSNLDFLIPQETDVDIEHALSTAESPAGEETNVLARIPQRSLLYFDEKLTVYAVFRTPYQDDEALQKYVARLNIVMEAHAFSSPAITSPTPDAHPAASARDIVWASKVEVTEDPVFVVVGSDEDEDGQDVLLMWKMSAFLNRPRVRLQAPAIMFKVSAVLQPPMADKSVEAYLPSGKALPNNLLASLNEAVPAGDSEIFLSSSRLLAASRPQGSSSLESIPLRVIPRRAFRAIPAISSRLRYHRSGPAGSKGGVIASLELDIPTFAQHPIEVHKAGLSYTGGQEHTMISDEPLQLPAIYNAKDSVVCLYSLNPEEMPMGQPNSNVRSLDVAVDARVIISARCHPEIQIRWRQTIDIGAIMQQTAAKAGTLQRDHRPPSLLTGGNPHPPLPNAAARTSYVDGANVTASLKGTKTIRVGEPFKWELSVVNRSDRTRQFSMTVIPRRRNIDGPRGRLRGSSLPGSGSAKPADAFVDENALYGTMKSQDLEPAQVTCLSPNAQTHAMHPGGIYTTELEFLALKKGSLHIEAIRVTDLETGDAVDVRNLPDIIAIEHEAAN